jgi:hypothetical protein
MEKYIAQILFLVGLAAWMAWVIVRHYLAVDIKEPERTGEPPSDAQIKWYIRQMRQDISLLTVTNFAVLLVLVFAFVLRF